MLTFNLEKLDIGRGTGMFLMVVCCFCPGFLGIFFYDRDLFHSTDTIKLILLSICLSIPFYLISFVLGYLLYESMGKPKGDIPDDEEKLRQNRSHNDSLILVSGGALSVGTWLLAGFIVYIAYLILNFQEKNYYLYTALATFMGVNIFYCLRFLKEIKNLNSTP